MAISSSTASGPPSPQGKAIEMIIKHIKLNFISHSDLHSSHKRRGGELGEAYFIFAAVEVQHKGFRYLLICCLNLAPLFRPRQKSSRRDRYRCSIRIKNADNVLHPDIFVVSYM